VGELCKAAAVSPTSFYPDIYGNFVVVLVSQYLWVGPFLAHLQLPIFLKNKISFFNFSKFPGGNGLVCEGERTCCPANVESALRHSAASDFHHAVRQSSHQLRHTLTQSSTAIQGENPNSNRRERVGKIKNKKQTCLQHENIFLYIQKERKSFFGFV
jgi:hypothetical protein